MSDGGGWELMDISEFFSVDLGFIFIINQDYYHHSAELVADERPSILETHFLWASITEIKTAL